MPEKASVSVERSDGKLRMRIDDFVSPTIVERLKAQAGVLAPQIDDSPAMVDSVIIDPAYDGQVFNVALADVPEKKADLVAGEYVLDAPIAGLRVGIYLLTPQGEHIFTSFDTDDADKYERYPERKAGHYASRCAIPADFLNEGRYVVGVNASSFRVRRYFQDEQALAFNVDGSGAPGTHWVENRFGLIRPRLQWDIHQS